MFTLSYPVPRPAASAVLACFLLAGCAGTHVVPGSVTASHPELSRPRTLSVAFRDDSPVPKRPGRLPGHLRDVAAVEMALRNDLERLFVERDLAVVDPERGADLALLCTVTAVRSGSEAARLLIGYGAGKAVLRLSVTLSRPGAAGSPLLSFATAGTTGAMPGAGLGFASAAGAAGTAIHMIGPALGVPGTLLQGLGQEAAQATTAIDRQMATYFAAQNWPYPGPAPSGPNRS